MTILYTLFSILHSLLWLSFSVALSNSLHRSGRYPAPCSKECGLSSTGPEGKLPARRAHPAGLVSLIITFHRVYVNDEGLT